VSMGLYFPILILGAAYAALTAWAGIVSNRGDRDRSERFRDFAFGAALLAAGYTAILVILVAVDTPNRFSDAVTIILVICAFFGLLLVVLYLIAQVVGLVTRRAR
jgi:uncharacterized membrane protein YccC